MYLDFLVKIPFVQGKITRRKKKDAVYMLSMNMTGFMTLSGNILFQKE